MKGWAAPWPGGGAGGKQEVLGGRAQAWGGGFGSSGCKGINPSRSQLEAGESPTLLGKGFM